MSLAPYRLCKAVRMTRAGLHTLLMLALLVTSVRTPAEELDHGRLIERTANSIDELLAVEHRELTSYDERGRPRRHRVRPLDRKKLVPTLAYMLNMTEPMLERAFVTDQYPLTDILFARHLAEKQSAPFEVILKKRPVSEWLKALKTANVSLKDVSDTFDHVFAQLASKALDERYRVK